MLKSQLYIFSDLNNINFKYYPKMIKLLVFSKSFTFCYALFYLFLINTFENINNRWNFFLHYKFIWKKNNNKVFKFISLKKNHLPFVLELYFNRKNFFFNFFIFNTFILFKKNNVNFFFKFFYTSKFFVYSFFSFKRVFIFNLFFLNFFYFFSHFCNLNINKYLLFSSNKKNDLIPNLRSSLYNDLLNFNFLFI